MLLAVHRRLAAFDTKARMLHVRDMRTTFVANVDHTVLCVVLARHCCFAAFDIEIRTYRAGVP